MTDFDFEKWLDKEWSDKSGVDTRTIHIRGAYREFRELIEAAVEAVQGIPDGDDGDGSYWLGHLNYLQLKQALRDLGITDD